MIPRHLWPVYGFRDGMKVVFAHFFEWTDAATFAMHPRDFNGPRCELYIGQAKPDNRQGGYHA